MRYETKHRHLVDKDVRMRVWCVLVLVLVLLTTRVISVMMLECCHCSNGFAEVFLVNTDNECFKRSFNLPIGGCVMAHSLVMMHLATEHGRVC